MINHTNWYNRIKTAVKVDPEMVLVNPTQDELIEMLRKDPNHQVRGIIAGSSLYICGATYSIHATIAQKVGVSYDMENRVVFFIDRYGDYRIQYESEQVGKIYKNPAIARLGFNAEDDVMDIVGKKHVNPVKYDKCKHSFDFAQDVSDLMTLRDMCDSGEAKEGTIWTDSIWMYQVVKGKPVKICGVTADYDYDAKKFSEPRTNF